MISFLSFWKVDNEEEEDLAIKQDDNLLVVGHIDDEFSTLEVYGEKIYTVNFPLTLSLPSSKSTFSQPFKEKCISEVVRIGSIIILHLIKLWKVLVLHTVMYNLW